MFGWAVFVVFPVLVRGDLLIRKCCPEGQQLNGYLTGCVDVPGREADPLARQKIPVAELRGDFPWWMNETVKPLSVDSMSEVSSFLGGQEEGKYVEIGVKQPCDEHMMTAISTASSKVSLLRNGSLVYRTPNSGAITFSPGAYCTDAAQSKNRTTNVILLCPCLETTCVRKCCNPRSLLSIKEERHRFTTSCVNNSGPSWEPEFYVQSGAGGNMTRAEAAVPHVVFYRKMVCGEERAIIMNDDSDWWIYPNGSVLVKKFGNGVPFGPEHYCGDLLLEEEQRPRILICARMAKSRPLGTKQVTYSVMLLLGAFFLLLTLVVLALLPRRYRDLLAKSVMCHCACFLLGYVTLGVSFLMTVVPHESCILLPFIIQFSFLAAFFWLNVMCIDISWAFSGFRPPQGSVTERDRKKFLYYSLYAWGSPTVITIVTAIMEFVKEIPDTYLKPDFAIKSCWFKEKSAAFAYFYGPMAVLLLANFVLFVYTTVKIIRVQRDTRILHNGESGRHDGSNFKKDKKRLILYAKLFCLMGLTWVTEIISWLHGSPQYYWYVTDAINLLRAVFIFVIFCCKRKVFRLLKQRLFPSLTTQNTISQSNGTRKSSGSSTQNSSLPSMQMTQIKRSTKGEKSTPGNP